MFCPKCGKEIKDGSKFCKHCGSEIKKNKNGTSAPDKVKTQSSDDEKTKKIIIGVLVAAIVILAIVFVAFGTGMFNGNSQNTNANAQPQANLSSSKPVSLNSFPVSEAPALAQTVKNSGGNFPVSFKSLSLSKAQCLYILSKSISQIGSGHPDATISVGDYSYAPHPSGSDSSQTIQRANYVDMCNRFSSWIESDGAVPNYIGVYTPGAADVSPSRMLDICVSILIDYGNTKNLPSSVNI